MELKGHMGSISFDGQTVVITKKMRGQVRVPLAGVSGVMLVPAGVGMGGVRVSASGGTGAEDVKAGGSHRDLATDPYALTFRKKHEPKFVELVDRIMAAKAAV